MVSVTCPLCNREVTARKNVALAFRFHLGEAHNGITLQEQDNALVGAMAHKTIRLTPGQNPLIPKGTPEGLRLVLEGKASYEETLRGIKECCEAHPHCEYAGLCKLRYSKACSGNRWPVTSDGVIDPAIERHRVSEGIAVVIPPAASIQRVLEALEGQLAKV